MASTLVGQELLVASLFLVYVHLIDEPLAFALPVLLLYLIRRHSNHAFPSQLPNSSENKTFALYK